MPPATRKIRRISPSRQAAFDVLEAVDGGAYASDLLRNATAPLSSRDAALASQIVFGALRYRLQLDYLIYLYSGRPADALHRAVKNILRTAIFQLRYLERVPVHAAVHEAVELTKQHRRPAAGLVNAVLRKVNRQPVAWPDRATELSCPAWLLERWEQHFGRESATAVAQTALLPPEEYIRVPRGQEPPAGLTVERTDIPGAYRILSGDRPAGLRLHDISSQAILPLLELQANDRYLDLCAAPGNKTRQALESCPRLAIACDISFPRLQTIGPICPRLVLDGTAPLPFPPQSFDRIFIDAPCSGTGTIRRNPEIKWRVTIDDLGRFADRQTELVKQSLTVLAGEGRLLYATCSLETEENENVLAAVCQADRRVSVERTLWRLPGTDRGDGFYGAVLRFRNA